MNVTPLSSPVPALFHAALEETLFNSHGRLLRAAAGGGDFPRGILFQSGGRGRQRREHLERQLPDHAGRGAVDRSERNARLDAGLSSVEFDGANAFNLGGQWQVFVQALGGSDRGGVECWMAQDYGNLPWEPHDGSDSYTRNADWTANVNRVSHDPATGYAFHKGDLVMITANGSLFYGGMQNVNEEHTTGTNINSPFRWCRPILVCPRRR
jgi:hypothetical protein